jgi:hypothetical protein
MQLLYQSIYLWNGIGLHRRLGDGRHGLGGGGQDQAAARTTASTVRIGSAFRKGRAKLVYRPGKRKGPDFSGPFAFR